MHLNINYNIPVSSIHNRVGFELKLKKCTSFIHTFCYIMKSEVTFWMFQIARNKSRKQYLDVRKLLNLEEEKVPFFF